jgi:hypothetical protein
MELTRRLPLGDYEVYEFTNGLKRLVKVVVV